MSDAGAQAPDASGRRSADGFRELVERATSLRAPDEVAEERRIRSLSTHVRGDAGEVEERVGVSVGQLEQSAIDVLRCDRVARSAEPLVHCSILRSQRGDPVGLRVHSQLPYEGGRPRPVRGLIV